MTISITRISSVTALVLVWVVYLVSANAQGRESAAGPASPDAEGVTLEVASVRMSSHDSYSEFPNFNASTSPRLNAKYVTLELLVGMAYGVQAKNIAGPSGWPFSEHFDIEAKADGDGPLSAHQRQLLLQQVLVSRFGLKRHSETKVTKGYTLIVGKGGPNLTPSTETGQSYIRAGEIQSQSVSLKGLAGLLSRQVDEPVADGTHMLGTFRVKLDYAPPDAINSKMPSIFTALQDTLGLKLIPAKIPVEKFVIDHIDRIPSSN